MFVCGGGWGLKLVSSSFTLIKGELGQGQTQTGLQMLRKCNYFRMCVSFGCSVNISIVCIKKQKNFEPLWVHPCRFALCHQRAERSWLTKQSQTSPAPQHSLLPGHSHVSQEPSVKGSEAIQSAERKLQKHQQPTVAASPSPASPSPGQLWRPWSCAAWRWRRGCRHLPPDCWLGSLPASPPASSHRMRSRSKLVLEQTNFVSKQEQAWPNWTGLTVSSRERWMM